MNSKKILTIFLFLVMLLVWSIVVKNIIQGFIGKDKNVAVVKDKNSEIESNKTFTEQLFRKTLKDPFAKSLFARVETIYTPPPKPKIEPYFALQGIAGDKAILLKTTAKPGKVKMGDTIIVSSGDIIDGGKVIKITENYIVIESEKKKFKISTDYWGPYNGE